MNLHGNVLIVCKRRTRTAPVVDALMEKGVAAVVCYNLQDAILRLKDRAFDLLIAETTLDDDVSSLGFLSEARKRLPSMQRVLLETSPLQISAHALVNDIAPCAILPAKINVEKILEILAPKTARTAAVPDQAEESEEETDTLTELEKVNLITDISVQLNSMIEDPNIVLPVLPEIAFQVRQLMTSENCTFENVAELVELEQGMSARILQVANSAIYAGLERIRNLQQAVGRLGLRETLNILQAVIAQNLFHSKVRKTQQLMRTLWMHSICTAYSNENLAARLKIPHSEDYFLMGLLHDVGKLLILHLIEIGNRQGLWKNREVTEDVLRKLFAMRHHDLGARLLEKWHYPAIFTDVVRLHNDDAGIRTRSEAVIVTYYSNLLTRKIGCSLIPYENEPLSNKELADALNMTEQLRYDLEASLRDIAGRIEKSCFGTIQPPVRESI